MTPEQPDDADPPQESTPPGARRDERLVTGRDRTLAIGAAKLIAQVARSVAYLELIFEAGQRAEGTGFLIAPALLLTNHHNVVHEKYGPIRAITADFDREEGFPGMPLVVRGILPPVAESTEHDWAAIRLERRVADRTPIALGSLWPITKDDPIIIIQHPLGGFKRFALDALSLQFFDDDVIRYLADTQKGSSGSPVFNSRLHCIALHHAEAEVAVEEGKKAATGWRNEGIRIERVMEGLRGACIPFDDDAEGFITRIKEQLANIPTREHDARAAELAYLDALVTDYRGWAQKYTPLAGIAEVRAAAADGPRLDLPMLFMPAGFDKLTEHDFGGRRQIERVPVDDLREAAARYRRLVVLGEPGSGKTTTLRRLAYDAALAAQADPNAPLPLFVPLGAYTGPEPALRYTQDTFRELAGDLADHLPAYLRNGRLLLLLDALNEMPGADYAERVSRIQKLLDQFPDAPVVVTCRALDYVETLRLEKLEIKPLDPERQSKYLERYLGEADGEALFWQMMGKEYGALWRAWRAAGGSWAQFWTAERMPDAVYKRTTGRQDSLWAGLRKGDLPPMIALGRNPFMLVMTAHVYAAGDGTLPANRGRLFAAFVDTLLAREETRDHASPWLGGDAMRRGLSALAFAMQQAGERGTSVEEAWAKRQLTRHAADPGALLYLAASATLLDLSGGRVRFIHQLIQEYFAALAWEQAIAGGDDLATYWPRGWIEPSGWEETAVLLAGVTPDMTPLVQRLLNVHPALAARCIAESGGAAPAALVVDAVRTRLAAIATRQRLSARERLAAIVSGRNDTLRERVAAGVALNHLGDPRKGVGLTPDGLPDILWSDPIPAGPFPMGEGDDQHSETSIKEPYRISIYPITNAQYDAFVADEGYAARWEHCWTAAGRQWKGDRTGP
jgi:hypothetical protein